MTSEQLLQILRMNTPFRQLLSRQLMGGRSIHLSHEENDARNQSEDGEYGGFGSRRRCKAKNLENKYPKVPSEEGRVLMRSGFYGSHDHFSDIRRRRKNNISERLMWRRLGIEPRCSYRRANRLIRQVYSVARPCAVTRTC